TEHQPGLVAVPERRHRTHHLVALPFVFCKRKKDADAQIKAVENDVERHRGADQSGPDHGKMPFHAAVSDGGPLLARSTQRPDCAADMGLMGVRCPDSSLGVTSGPPTISRLI